MFEIVELAKVLDGFPRRQPGFVCEACGNVRFMPCGNCSGSRKVFDEDEGVPKSCLECNENGLIRCPDCAYEELKKGTRNIKFRDSLINNPTATYQQLMDKAKKYIRLDDEVQALREDKRMSQKKNPEAKKARL
ncbi:uncharacterized protein LOC110621580 [Manihot esculenta]|uniref:uncharacterized protein LOC110621580 n=1 Tax=Manihot esculenta TaxID=3983 RepID=UPI000B5D45E8|nr:uncharacterized protein LOC110621580 [Manihot esculenta]